MSEMPPVESAHERRVTWSLIGAVAVFVLLMSCIVVWITSSLIKQRFNESNPTSERPTQGTAENTAAARPSETADYSLQTSATLASLQPAASTATAVPGLVEITWVPRSSPGQYARFVYWYAKPSQIQVGECLQLTWVTEYAKALKLYRSGELILDNAPPSAIFKDCPTKQGYAVYKLVVLNNQGTTNFIQLQVKVGNSP